MDRVSVNINESTEEILRTVMAERGITATEATRRAIGLLEFVERTYRTGGFIYTEDPGGSCSRIIWPPRS